MLWRLFLKFPSYHIPFRKMSVVVHRPLAIFVCVGGLATDIPKKYQLFIWYPFQGPKYHQKYEEIASGRKSCLRRGAEVLAFHLFPSVGGKNCMCPQFIKLSFGCSCAGGCCPIASAENRIISLSIHFLSVEGTPYCLLLLITKCLGPVLGLTHG